MSRKIRIGTRGSKLALIQTELVKKAITERFSDIECETVIIRTKGDKLKDKPISELGGVGAFANEVERSLLDGETDIAVHSAKDLPTQLSDGLEVRCVLKRADPRDVLIYRSCTDMAASGLRIGTGSIRRRENYLKLFPGSAPQFFDIRGNVDSRIEKLRSGSYDAIILAAAGLERLGILPFIDNEICCSILSLERSLPAPCQAIIAVESRKGELSEILDVINDENTLICFNAERQILSTIGGDCSKPIGALSSVEKGKIHITASMGRDLVTAEGPVAEWRQLAESAAKKL